MTSELENGLARAIAFVAVLFVASAILSFVLLVIEAFLRNPSAAEWAQALGGILAVGAAAWIAAAESRRSRRQMDVQIELQNALIQHNQALVEEARLRDRLSAVASIRAAYGIVGIIAGALSKEGKVSETFFETWSSNFVSARRWLAHVNVKDMNGPLELHSLAQFHTDVEDLEILLRKAATSNDNRELCAFFTAMFRTKLSRMRSFVDRLDGEWVSGISDEALELSLFEKAQMSSDPQDE